MAKDMIGPITRALVGVPLEHQGVVLDVIQRLGNTGNNSDAWAALFSDVIHKGLPQVKDTVLELVGTVAIGATTGKFVAKEKFVINTRSNAPVKISYLGDNFKAWFLNGGGMVEDYVTTQTLHYHKLREASVDKPIIAELGGEEKSETTLTEIYDLMARQPNGEKGALLNNGWWNIFYVCDTSGVLRAVNVRWDDAGWSVDADSIENPGTWNDGDQVFSRNPVVVLESSGASVSA